MHVLRPHRGLVFDPAEPGRIRPPAFFLRMDGYGDSGEAFLDILFHDGTDRGSLRVTGVDRHVLDGRSPCRPSGRGYVFFRPGAESQRPQEDQSCHDGAYDNRGFFHPLLLFAHKRTPSILKDELPRKKFRPLLHRN